MIPSTDDTICAIASAAGGAARGIVRIAGPQAIDVAAKLFVANEADTQLSLLRTARAIEGALNLEAFAAPVPTTLYVWPGPQSYTRSAMVEIHTIGSPPILEAVLADCCRSGARLAQPGEFTMRAFLAGRMDLTQAEAVLGVIDAQDNRQLQTALRQLAGGLAGPLAEVRQALIHLLAELEAGLDFVEEDIEFVTNDQVRSELADATRQVTRVATQLGERTDQRQLACVVLVGAANAGKSTLFNAILVQAGGTDHAAPSIVSPQPGTTRDYRTATIAHGETSWQLVDTAGIESVDDADEPRSQAQLATQRQDDEAEIRLLCIDSSRTPDAWEAEQLDHARERYSIVIATKSDMAANLADSPIVDADVRTSAVNGEGVSQLLAQITAAVIESHTSAGDAVASTAARCRESLGHVRECLERAESLAADDGQHELIAAELRAALDHLGQVVGTVYTDDILDRIFSQFCIGK